MPAIQLNGQLVDYQIRHSSRAQYVSLRIDEKRGLQVVLPKHVTNFDVDSLLLERETWILHNLAKVEARQQQRPQRQWITGETIPYLGEQLTLNIQPKPHGKRTTVTHDRDILNIWLVGNPQADHIQDTIEKWYKRQAKRYIPPRVIELAGQFGFDYAQIRIKNQRTRWGSCSSKGNLNFNLRLMMTPPDAIDYIIIHELCHLKEMNHSRRFWNLVAQYDPDYQHWRRWFKENSTFLNF